MTSLLVRGGTLVTAQGTMRGDVLLEGETIAAVGPGLARSDAVRTVDADGLLVLPGLIDPHVHLREPGGTQKEDFGSGTAAALAGGITTVLAMPNTNPPLTDRATFAATARLVERKALCNVGLFVGATPTNVAEAAALDEAVGLKLYMGATTGSLLVASLDGLLAHLATYPRHRPLAVHAEDDEAVRWFTGRGLGRPPLCALLALARLLNLAAYVGRSVHICHVSTGQELALIRAARERGLSVTCEVTPHHLLLSDEDAARLGPLGRVNPPLRAAEEQEALWAGLGDITCLATDHAPHTLAEKRGAHPPAGLPGLETSLSLLLTEVAAGRLSLREVVRLMGTGPAEVYGLRDKGCLAPGCEADLVLVDPQAEWTVGERPLFTRCGWSPFGGRRLRGRVVQVWLRGQLAYDEGQVRARPTPRNLLTIP